MTNSHTDEEDDVQHSRAEGNAPITQKSNTDGVRQSSRLRKLKNIENDNLLHLRAGMSYLVSFFTKVKSAPRAYAAFKATIEKDIKLHEQRLMFYQEAVELNVDGSTNFIHPLCMTAKSRKNDVSHFHEAMRQPDREEFIQAMMKELRDHHENKHWRLVKRFTIGNAKTVKAI
mmetsp:Transcript_21410/g.29994  ORF Transcript_21410/g.29994 Transcript_21410/m.29994 type:complete len:173 (+) Transcript_21410:38-556(+)